MPAIGEAVLGDESAEGIKTDRKARGSVLATSFIIPEISLCDVSGITTKVPYEAALIHECHVRIEIAGFVMCTFVLKGIPCSSPTFRSGKGS